MAAPWALRSSGASLPSVASSAEIDPFLPSAATRAASSALSSGALSIAASVTRSRPERSDIPPGLPARRLALFSPGLDGEGFWPRLKPSLAIAGGEGDTPASGGLRQRAFRLLDDRGERSGLGNGEVGQHLAVDFDPRRGQAGDKAAVSQSLLTHRRVDALNPQSAKLALAVLAVAISVLHRLVDRGLGGADGVLAPAKEPLGGLQHLLVLSVGGYAPFDACHRSNLREKGSAVRQEEFLDLVAVGLEQNQRAAQIANLLGRALDHAVPLAALGVDDLAGPGDFEALFRA